MSRKRPVNMKIMPTMCATCPFRPGSPTAYLKADLTLSALQDCSRVCHSTGSNNAFHRRTGVPEMLCRGARDVQLAIFHLTGFLEAATDEAWDRKVEELGLKKPKKKPKK